MRPLLLGSALLATGALGGCASGNALEARRATVQSKLEQVRVPARKCAERELALAEANLDFVILELEQGALFRAGHHMQAADEAMAIIDTVARRPECQADGDGDGIPDAVDACPEVPEDLDGYEDTDGCPEDQDTDGDGIPDSRDQCPKEPEDFDGDADEDGCPETMADRDGDGIGDAVDRCPDQPEDKDGFEDADGCPDLDNDQDGLPDLTDRCPINPEDKDGFEDEDGCPDPDNDQDRIPDAQDQCPDQPEDYDGDADTDGCPDVFKNIVVRADRIDLKQKIFFSTNKATIRTVSYELLNEVAEALRQNPAIKVRIEGHTDSQGSAKYNLKLSRDRAASVRRYLMGQGIEPSRLESEGYGEERPIEDNRTADGREANRRVEFHISR
ncbi:MAG: OmpA family protein [Myxococcales bacterium]|nr:OmpA family protein [Myxococcales bacterium]